MYQAIYNKYFSGGASSFKQKIGVRENVLYSIQEKFVEKHKCEELHPLKILKMFNYFNKPTGFKDLSSNWKEWNVSFNKNVWKTCLKLGTVMNTIKLENLYNPLNQEIDRIEELQDCNLIIDTFPCRLAKSTDEDFEHWTYDHKHGFNSFLYQIVVNIHTGLICSINGPFYGRRQDSLFFRNSPFYNNFVVNNNNQKILGDSAYFCFQNCVTKCSFSKKEHQWKRSIITRARQLVEQVIGKINKFEIIKVKPFKCSIKYHPYVVKVICETVNIDIMLNKPFDNIFVFFNKKDILRWKARKQDLHLDIDVDDEYNIYE